MYGYVTGCVYFLRFYRFIVFFVREGPPSNLVPGVVLFSRFFSIAVILVANQRYQLSPFFFLVEKVFVTCSSDVHVEVYVF